jgi:hypothetical protein
MEEGTDKTRLGLVCLFAPELVSGFPFFGFAPAPNGFRGSF